MKRLIAWIFVLILCLPQALAEETQHDRLQAEINKIAQRWSAVGVAVAYVRDGVVADTFEYGYAVRKSLKMTADTNVRTASISKVMAGIAAHWSEENGIMDLDESIDAYLGYRIRLRHADDVITARSILRHISSIDVLEDKPRTYEDIKAHLTGKMAVLSYASGDIRNWAYNNYAFYVLGIAIERANGKTIDQILDAVLEDKLQIDAAFWAGDLKDTQNVASVYNNNRQETRSRESLIAAHAAGVGEIGSIFAGNYCASARDLGKIVAMLAADGRYDGERIISESIVQAMEEYIPVIVPGESFYQAQPLRYRENIYGRDGLYYHTGSSKGEMNLIIYDPVAGDGVAVLSTGAYGRDDYDIYAVCGEIAALLFDEYAESEKE